MADRDWDSCSASASSSASSSSESGAEEDDDSTPAQRRIAALEAMAREYPATPLSATPLSAGQPARQPDGWAEQPASLRGVTLYDYQLAGFNWMLRLWRRGEAMRAAATAPAAAAALDGPELMLRTAAGGILGDEMGLGKTLQTAALLSHLVGGEEGAGGEGAAGPVGGPFLIVCPLSVAETWCAELARHAPALRVLRLFGSKAERGAAQEEVRGHVKGARKAAKARARAAAAAAAAAATAGGGTDDEAAAAAAAAKRRAAEEEARAAAAGAETSGLFNTAITTFEGALSELDFLRRLQWKYVVLDEAQRIKSAASRLHRALASELYAPHRMLLTGTPLMNNLGELHSLLAFCNPRVFGWPRPPRRAQGGGGGGGGKKGGGRRKKGRAAPPGRKKRFLSLFEAPTAKPEAAAAAAASASSSSSSSGGGSGSGGSDAKLRSILRHFLLRRTRANVLAVASSAPPSTLAAAALPAKAFLPPLTEVVVRCTLTALQRRWYVAALTTSA